MSESIKLTYNVPGDDFTRAGEASSDVKGVLKKLGLSPVVVRKVAIAMYEGEINMVIHGGGGQIAVEIGGVLTVENPYVARAKLKRIRKYRPVSCNHIDGEDLSAFFWDEAVEYEPVLELDADFRTAMEKMKTMREIEARLYGMDCGSCGAPSCKALAEDIVRGFATEEACIFKLREEIDGMAESLRRLSRVMPKADGDKSR